MKKLFGRSLLVLFTAGVLTGQAGHVDAGQKKSSKIPEFKEVPFPVTDADKRKIMASEEVTVDGKTYRIGYNTILRSGDQAGEGTFGLLMDQSGNPVLNKDGSRHISVDNDFSSLLPVGNKLFMVSHFESRPGAMYLTELGQDQKTGKLKAIKTENIDFSAVGGLWVPCAGSVTPWGTHLGSEEYPNNARATEAAKSMDDIEDYDKPMARYFGLDPYATSTTVVDFRRVFKPYRYGYPVEVAVSEDGKPTVYKHYAMGRVAVELAYVMPDKRTVYISDDGTNVGFFMFVADRPEDLSSGTLYAAKWNQKHSANGGYADLSWINLGHADEDTIHKAVESGISFSDIFAVSEPKGNGTCEQGFTSVHTTTGLECLQIRPGMETIASRLETRRYAAMKGATTEFRKEEGITFDPDHKRLYVAMSQVAKGMEDGKKYDKGGPNHVRLPKNKCGVVYGLDIRPDATIGSEYVAVNMYGVVAGTMHKYPQDSEFANNTCDINSIANPDNITYMAGRDTLIIGEDTGSGHQNDAIWAYNVKTGKLTRIQTTPYGSETTSPYFYPNINGHAYLMSVIQHPYGESDEDKLRDSAEAKAYTGYIGPLPAMD
ncbi:alkaline phosphatase [Desulfolithobacter dissulfuricans]|uniref:Alkaline phosphatase n=1 Tax=Desulfolithobacter dissulfuricans TaxID=2795293 RepID=A0A915UB75_9BACT|nr:alkaline phosphatase PhoX [Desulfolithobacter dissulfuricans]BCO10370.1 alkaline phosphatase [Desulfolithobacter dissulfuricans]